MVKISEVVSEVMLSDGDQVQEMQDDGEMQEAEGGSEREVSSESQDGGSEISEREVVGSETSENLQNANADTE